MFDFITEKQARKYRVPLLLVGKRENVKEFLTIYKALFKIFLCLVSSSDGLHYKRFYTKKEFTNNFARKEDMNQEYIFR